MRSSPEEEQLAEFEKLSVEDMVTVMEVIDAKVIKRSFPDCSLKLVQLRKWR